MTDHISALNIAFNEHNQKMLFSYPETSLDSELSLPFFEIEEKIGDVFELEGQSIVTELLNGAFEQSWTFRSTMHAGLKLDIMFRGFPQSPVLRFKYRLHSNIPYTMTRSRGNDQIEYFQLAMQNISSQNLTEIQLSHFDHVAHSYMPYHQNYEAEEVIPGMSFVGPIALFHSVDKTVMVAYEHGADHPNSFLRFTIEEPGNQCVLRAEKGNYYHGRVIEPGHDWDSVWFELALYPTSLKEFLPVYRRFFLDEVCINPQSRTPYIFYNTWNYQERQKYFLNRPYLSDMNAERMLAEIDVAHQIGVDVFVIDTGWYVKTGDWLPNRERFPEGLLEIKRKLDSYGMKLGLWFNPTVAALTSRIYQEHPEYEMTWNGQVRWRGKIWETEESASMCLASNYTDDFVETMVRLNRELGVSYFKWDAISQYGCNSPLHNHGTEHNTPEERAECYAYESGRAMIRIVEEVSRRCPDVIVDFDVTEGGRFVGLGFLSVGKYFLINNGPYFHDFDIPRTVKIDPDTINVFFYPGPARPRICRQGIKYDSVIPSILFLTHYLPDGPRLSQVNSIASLVLGGNGFWGDLPALSEDDVAYLSQQISLYKQVSGAVTRATPRMRGFAGSSPEIHEKIDPESASGLVAFFTVTPGKIHHYTQRFDISRVKRVEGADQWEPTADGRLKLTVELESNDARVVYIIS